jgi:hypothetical protein
LNVFKIRFETDEKQFVKSSAAADRKALGRRLGKQLNTHA